MKIEKVNDNKIKVMFNSSELEENNISVHSFLAGSSESQKLFLAILDIASEEFGFNTDNCKVSCETISFNNKNFVTIVTKSTNKSTITSNSYNLLDFTESLSQNSLSYPISLKSNLIYKFSTIEDARLFCGFFMQNFSALHIISSLYQYNDQFFLKINSEKLNSQKLQNMISILSEFGTRVILSELTVLKLEECSKLVIENNAINSLSKASY